MTETGGGAPSLYDLLDVDPTADEGEVRAAWRAAIADLTPADRRFRAYNQAAEVLLDPQQRAAYDAQLASRPTAPPEGEPVDAPAPATAASPPTDAPAPAEEPGPAATRGRRTVPAWLLVVLGVLTLAVLGATAYVWTQPSDTAVAESTRAAQAAAERAVVPVLSYDYRRLDEDAAAARPLLTSDYRQEYDKLFELIKDNAPSTETVVSVEVIASGVVRAGTDRAEILVFINQPTTNAKNTEPVVYKNQVRVQVEKVGDEWLVDCLITTPNGRC